MKILFYTCTKLNKKAFIEYSPLYKSLVTDKTKEKSDNHFTGLRFEGELVVNFENTKSLSVQYNKARKYYDKFDAVVYIHDDVFITEGFLQSKLEMGFAQFDIVGLAGGANPQLKKHGLWHLMCPRETMSGAVSHFTEDNKEFVTSFGPFGKRCSLMDGLFLAVHTHTVKETDLKWDENVMFHHYDLIFCLDANKKSLRMGTAPIYVVHESPGLKNFSKEYLQSEKYFIDYFNNY